MASQPASPSASQPAIPSARRGADDPAGADDPYAVVLLVEQPLARVDARAVRALHEGLEDALRYHVLLPVDDAAGRVEAAMGTLAAGEVVSAPGLVLDPEQVQAVHAELLASARHDLALTQDRLREAAADHAGRSEVTGEVVCTDPLEALERTVSRLGAREVVVLTRPHVVAELFHLDWASRARRRLGVPVLHLLEHEEQGAPA